MIGEALKILVFGMLGIFVVIGIIIGALKILMITTPKGQEDS